MTQAHALPSEILSAFSDIAGADYVITDPGELRYYSEDVYRNFETALAVIKTTATLRLVTIPAVVKYASFSFETHQQICAAMSEIGRRGLAAECYGFDPFLQNSRVLGGDTDVVEDVKTLARVAGKSGLKESIRIAASGRRFVKKVQWGLHVNVEDRCEAGADHALAEICRIAEENSGGEIPNSLPTIVGAYPFPPTNSMVGPDGERWVPIHGKVGGAHREMIGRIKELLDENGVINPGQLGLNETGP